MVRQKLPADPVAALRALGRILERSPSAVAAFFAEPNRAKSKPDEVARRMKTRRKPAGRRKPT